MSFLQTLKEVVVWEKDDDFFDKEATIKEYFKVCPPDKRKKAKNYEELYIEALKYVNKQNFEENTSHMEDYFYEMTQEDASIAILTGVFAYAIAYGVDKNGKKLEDGIDNILPDGFDKNNPFDKRCGKNHRIFGHDIFSFALKGIPNDYPILVPKVGRATYYEKIGEFLHKNGRITMLDLIWKVYGEKASNPIEGIFSCVGHTIVHFAKDLLTAEGVPLPFSGLLADYYPVSIDDDILDQDDYILENKFNDWVNKYNGNMKASDFATLGFISGTGYTRT